MDIAKILAKLKTRFKNLGFSDKAFTGVATYLAPTVKDDATDDEIETAIAGVEPVLKAFQGDIDARVNTAVEKAKKEAARKVAGAPTEEPEEEEEDKDTPAWAKKLFKQNKELTEKLNKFENGQVQQTLSEKLAAKLKEKKIPEAFAKGLKVEKEEDLDNAVAEAEKDFLEVKQSLNNQGFSQGTPPLGGTGEPPEKAKIEADITGWAAKRSPKTEASK